MLWVLSSRVSGELGGSTWGWLPILPMPEVPVEIPASNICQGMAGAGKYRPGVVLPGHNAGCPQPVGSRLPVPVKGLKPASPQQCTVLPRDWYPGVLLSPPQPQGPPGPCALLPLP